MHDYTSVRYLELRDPKVLVYEVDIDGIPTSLVMTAMANEEVPYSYWWFKSEFENLLKSYANFVCECGMSMYSWDGVLDHLSNYCDHEYISDERCPNCGRSIEATPMEEN